MTTKKTTETKASDQKLRYIGGLHPATREGWARAIAEMNLKDAEGYDVVTVQRLDTSVGVLYRMARPKLVPRDARLVDEEDESDYESRDIIIE